MPNSNGKVKDRLKMEVLNEVKRRGSLAFEDLLDIARRNRASPIILAIAIEELVRKGLLIASSEYVHIGDFTVGATKIPFSIPKQVSVPEKLSNSSRNGKQKSNGKNGKRKLQKCQTLIDFLTTAPQPPQPKHVETPPRRIVEKVGETTSRPNTQKPEPSLKPVRKVKEKVETKVEKKVSVSRYAEEIAKPCEEPAKPKHVEAVKAKAPKREGGEAEAAAAVKIPAKVETAPKHVARGTVYRRAPFKVSSPIDLKGAIPMRIIAEELRGYVVELTDDIYTVLFTMLKIVRSLRSVGEMRLYIDTLHSKEASKALSRLSGENRAGEKTFVILQKSLRILQKVGWVERKEPGIVEPTNSCPAVSIALSKLAS